MTDVRHDGSRTADKPVAELVKDLSQQTATLVRKEIELAKAEATVAGKRAGIGAGLFGGAGTLAFYGLGVLIAAAVLGLATVLDAWLAAVAVGVALLLVAGVLALIGKSRVKAATPPAPQTVETLKEDAAWARTLGSSVKR